MRGWMADGGRGVIDDFFCILCLQQQCSADRLCYFPNAVEGGAAQDDDDAT